MPEGAEQMAAQGGAPKAPPFGVTSATQQTPNRGNEAAAQQILATAVQMIGDALQKAGPTTELGQGIMKHLSGLAKLVPPGTSTPASQKNVMDQTAMKAAQNNQALQSLRAKAVQPQQQAAPQGMAA